MIKKDEEHNRGMMEMDQMTLLVYSPESYHITHVIWFIVYTDGHGKHISWLLGKMAALKRWIVELHIHTKVIYFWSTL